MHDSVPREHLSEGTDRYRVLLDVGWKLAGTLEMSELFETIHQETSRVVPVERCLISLHDGTGETGRVVYVADSAGAREVVASYPLAESIAAGEGVSTTNHELVRGLTAKMLGEDPGTAMRSSMAVPLVKQGVLAGTLTVQCSSENRYSDEDLEVFGAIADIATVAIDNASHVSELDRRRREAERMEEIGRALVSTLDPGEVLRTVITAVTELIPIDGAAVWLNDEPGGTLFRVAEAGGNIVLPLDAEWDLTTAVTEGLLKLTGPVIVPDLAASELVPGHLRKVLEAGSGLMVPLVVQGRLTGALTVGSARPYSFDSEDVALLQRLASQAAVALGNARLHEHVQTLSLMDPLTELPNRRRMQIHLDKEIPAARRGRGLVAALFDLDDFKRCNDTWGHLAGDEILRAFARILEGENRAMNLVARYGGDEFICLLSETGLEGAMAYVDRVVERVADDPVMASRGVSVSVGVAAFDAASMDSGSDLIDAADAELYEQKLSE